MNVKTDAVTLSGAVNTPERISDSVFATMEALELSLQNVAKDISQSREFLSTSFGQIAANFAKVHSIARAGEEREAQIPNDTLVALRRIVNGLTVELQFEDSLSQSLSYALRRLESICVALKQARASVADAGCARSGDAQGEHALAVLARTLDSLRNAERAGGSHLFEGNSGSFDMF